MELCLNTRHPAHPAHQAHLAHPAHSALPAHPAHPAHPVHTAHPGQFDIRVIPNLKYWLQKQSGFGEMVGRILSRLIRPGSNMCRTIR